MEGGIARKSGGEEGGMGGSGGGGGGRDGETRILYSIAIELNKMVLSNFKLLIAHHIACPSLWHPLRRL